MQTHWAHQAKTCLDAITGLESGSPLLDSNIDAVKGGLCPSAQCRPLNAFSMSKVALRRYIFRPIHLTYSFDPGIKLKVISRATSATIPHPSILDRLKNIDQNVIFGNFLVFWILLTQKRFIFESSHRVRRIAYLITFILIPGSKLSVKWFGLKMY